MRMLFITEKDMAYEPEKIGWPDPRSTANENLNNGII